MRKIAARFLVFVVAPATAHASQEVIKVPERAAEPVRIEKLVHIGKAKFQVRVRGNVAEVRRKNVSYNMNARHFEMGRQAAELASGCVAVDQSQQQDGLFVGPMFIRLNCATSPASASSD